MRHFGTIQPAEWIDTLVACRIPAVALIDLGEAPANVRKAVGAARKSLREPAELQQALRELYWTLQNHSADAGQAVD